MADYDSSLPIRTEAAGDVDVFVSDATTPTQKLKVNADGSVDVNASATDLDIRDLAFATDSVDVSGSTVTVQDGGGSITVDGTVAATQSGTWDIGTVTAVTSITNDVNIADGGNSITVDAVQLDIDDLDAGTDSVAAHLFDESGVAFSVTNPLPVVFSPDAEGDEIVNYTTSASVAKDASVNHDYTVTATKTLLIEQVWASASGKIKVQVLVNGAVKYVGFNSTANPNVEIPMRKLLKGLTAQVVRITITNLDNGTQDVYSTLSGVEL